MKNNLILALIASLAPLLSACSVDTVSSQDVSTQSIHQSYSVEYDVATNATTVWAQFRVGGFSGTTVSLKSPARVAANGQTLREHNFLGTFYSRSFAGYVSSVVLDWTGDDEHTHSNAISYKPVAITQAATTVDLLQAYQISVSAPELMGSDTVEARIRQEQNRNGYNESIVVNAVFSPQLNQLTFPASELARLQEGQAVLEVSRSRWQSLVEGTREGGGISATYRARSLELTLVGNPSTNKLAVR